MAGATDVSAVVVTAAVCAIVKGLPSRARAFSFSVKSPSPLNLLATASAMGSRAPQGGQSMEKPCPPSRIEKVFSMSFPNSSAMWAEGLELVASESALAGWIQTGDAIQLKKQAQADLLQYVA